ncbi:MAG: transglycosylase domain-containing protein [Hyphomicrobiales bacterium]
MFRIVSSFFSILSLFVIIVFLSFVIIYSSINSYNIDQKAVIDSLSSSATVFLSEDGNVIHTEYNEHRFYVTYDKIPDNLKYAFISAEDKNFYEHIGIDISSIARASLKNLYNYIFTDSNNRLIGASTITQQLVKNLFLDNQKTFVRKIKEIIIAIRLERNLSKEKILELYLNEIYLGRGAYGIVAASERYFNKRLLDLTIEEYAFLAALPKAPSRYDPEDNYESIKERRDWVLDRMSSNGYVTDVVVNVLKTYPIEFVPITDYQVVKKLNKKTLNKTMDELSNLDKVKNMLDNGFIVHMTINETLTNEIKGQVEKLNAINSNKLMNIDLQITSLVSGRKLVEYSQGEELRVSFNEKSSILKPLLFLAALESGLELNDKILSIPIDISSKRKLLTLRNLYEANEFSIPESLSSIDNSHIKVYLDKVGLEYIISEKFENERLLNIDELTSIYYPIINNGIKNQMGLIDSIDDKFGKQVHSSQEINNRILNEIHSIKMKSLMCGKASVNVFEDNVYKLNICSDVVDLGNKLFFIIFSNDYLLTAIAALENETALDNVYILDMLTEVIDELSNQEFQLGSIPNGLYFFQANSITGNRFNLGDSPYWEIN